MSGDAKLSSMLFHGANGKCLSVVSFTENDVAYFCMNGTVLPMVEFRQIVGLKESPSELVVLTASHNIYKIPNASASMFSHAMPKLMSQ